jgi:hypothetical protein
MANRVVLNDEEMRRLLSGKNGAVWQDINRRAQRVLNGAIVGCPVDQGTLRQSLSKEMLLVNNEPVARVGSNLEYAIYVHEGVGMYGPRKTPIVPVRAKALRWATKNNSGSGRRRYKGGATAAYTFSKRSKGFKGRPFLKDAVKYGK